MKRIVALLLAVMMVFALCACGGKKSEKLVIIDESLGAEQYGIAFRADDQETCDAIEAAVAKLVADGTYAEIAAKYEAENKITNNLLFLQNAPEVKDIQKSSRTFVMGIDPEYPPFSYMGSDGEYTGFDVDVCKAACELLGWDFEVYPVNWEQKLTQLDAGECDCIWSGMTILDSMKDAG